MDIRKFIHFFYLFHRFSTKLEHFSILLEILMIMPEEVFLYETLVCFSEKLTFYVNVVFVMHKSNDLKPVICLQMWDP